MKKLTKTELDQLYTEISSRINGYVLHGIDGQIILVVKTTDEHLIKNVIDKIGTSRIEELKIISKRLEMDLHDRNNRHPSETGSKNKTKGAVSNGSGSRKTKDTKHRS
jgi:hypothetical protein